MRFTSHQASNCHKDAVLKTVTFPATTHDVGESLSVQHAQEKLERRQCFLKLLSNVRFFARQALPFRGDGDESDSNYHQLLTLCGEDSRVLNWLKRKIDKYTSPVMQNEMSWSMRPPIRQIVNKMLFAFTGSPMTLRYTKNLWACNLWSRSKLIPWSLIKDILQRFNLSPSKIRGQCYDGTATMAGFKSGVATRLLQEEPKALYTHCYGHAQNLACGDMIKQIKLLKGTLDTTYDLIKLIKYSPQIEVHFACLKAELAPGTPGVRTLSYPLDSQS